MKKDTKIIEAEYRISGKTTSITSLIIGKKECFVTIDSLPNKKILVAEEICRRTQEAWQNDNPVNLLLGSLREIRKNVLTSDSLQIEVENPMDDMMMGE